MPEPAPSSELTPLILDFLEWVAAKPRPYSEVMDAWRTSCPRLTVWEDCVDRDLVARRHDPQRGVLIEATAQGLAMLARERGRRRPTDGLPAAAE